MCVRVCVYVCVRVRVCVCVFITYNFMHFVIIVTKILQQTALTLAK